MPMINSKTSAASLTIPQAYREEIHGIVEGYNRWLSEYRKENGISYFGKPLTYQDVVLWHAIMDLLKKEKVETPLSGSVVIEKKEQLAFARNLDLPSLSILGPHFLLIRREITARHRSVTITLPGTVGSFTGMNEHGLTCATSSAGTLFRPKGIPAMILQRQILDSCQNTADVQQKLPSMTSPACSHLLTIADPKTALTMQLSIKRTERPLSKDGHLIATNHFVAPNGFPSSQDLVPDVSEWRYRLIENDLSCQCPPETILERVQSIDTTQALIFYPSKRKIDVRLGNAFAAGGNPVSFTSAQLFG